MKLVLLNVKYSPNLGDGIIAECFEHALRATDPTLSVSSCDLAGRTAYGHGIDRSRQAVYAVLDRLPKPLRTRLVAFLLRQMIRRRLDSHYDRMTAGADVAVIGGGQLIADADLNFPLKIAAAVDRVRENGLELAIFGVGVGGSFSEHGYDLFRAAFRDDLISVGVRDEISRKRWDETYGPPGASIVHDPGLLAQEVYGAVERPLRDRPLVGVGIINPSTLSLHADDGAHDARRWRTFFVTLCEALVADGHDVQLFTNGASDDVRFARRVYADLPHALTSTGCVVPARQLDEPRDLAHLIASFDGLVAHRLHACIIAYSYGVPHIGLGWDRKMDGFFGSVGRREFLVSDGEPDAVSVASLTGTALKQAISRDEIETTAAATRNDIAALVGTLREQVRPG